MKTRLSGIRTPCSIIAGAIMLAAISLPVAADDFRVGFVDIERILRESDAAVKAEKRIEKEFFQRDQELRKLAKQAKDLQTTLEKEGVTLSDAERRNRERELSNLNMSLQRTQREYSEDLNLRKNEEVTAVLELANKAIQSVAESEKYDLVLQEAVYRNPTLDITDKVLKNMSGEK